MHNVVDARSVFNVRRCMANIERELKKHGQLDRYDVLCITLSEPVHSEIWLRDRKDDSYIGPVDLSLLTR